MVNLLPDMDSRKYVRICAMSQASSLWQDNAKISQKLAADQLCMTEKCFKENFDVRKYPQNVKNDNVAKICTYG